MRFVVTNLIIVSLSNPTLCRTLFKGHETEEAVLEMAGKTMHGKAYREEHHNP
jgi:hypothetical protein